MNTITKTIFGMLFVLNVLALSAQQDISGNVTDINEVPLPFVNVLIKGSTNGTTTDFDGNFALNGVKQSDILEFSIIGFETQNTTIGIQTFINISLKESAESLDEVVVTGVAVGTSVKKLGFALSKVGKEQLSEAPAADVGNALRGKVAGIRIVQGNGDPNTASSIRLRGSNSILGSQEPLIIIDGIITGSDTNLKDINMEDVASIEVIKGAAASSLYGSLSGNGVIQIITKRGTGNRDGKPKVVIRNETGFSQITSRYPLAKTHRWALNENADWDLNDLDNIGKWVLSDGGNRVYDEDGLLDNPFPRIVNNQENVNTDQITSTLYGAVSASGPFFKYHLSFQNSKFGGVVAGLDPSVRNNGRLNLDYNPNEKLSLKTSISYTNYKGVTAPYSTRGTILFLEPWIDLSERAEDGNYARSPTGYQYLASTYDNPLYEVGILEETFNRQRLMFAPDLTYRFNDNLTFGASYSHDESRSELYDFIPKEYVNPDPDVEENGNYEVTNTISLTSISQAYFSYAKQFGDFNTRLTGKFLREHRKYNRLYAEGEEFIVGGVKTLNVASTTNRTIESTSQEEKVSNYFIDANVDYKDKYIFNALVRRDGSSLFGENNRWQTFGRVSGAYILSEDLDIPEIDNLKLRYSWGVSGQRPAFNAQYETYSVDDGILVANILGNKNLLPSKVSEWEVGINAGFLGKYTLEVNYAKTNVKNDFIRVPLPAVSGYNTQWQNLGQIESTALEMQFGANLINTKDFNWNVNVSWDKVTQTITDLGDVPPFTRNNVSLF